MHTIAGPRPKSVCDARATNDKALGSVVALSDSAGETGLYYYRARCYNPTIGRFLQTDPIGYGDGMNMYAHWPNSVLGHTDPFGSLEIDRKNIDVGYQPWIEHQVLFQQDAHRVRP